MEERRVRVAAYCRVSTEQEDQRSSLENQQRYFAARIAQEPGWESVGIYVDHGLSGTSMRQREGFLRMLEAAERGEIDLILTKEVSRFARNTVDALRVTRHLRDCGVGVVFLTDGIDTRENDGEFRLTIMASVAQEESRKISERTRWGQTQAMRRGVVFGNDTTYAFCTQNGVLTVRPAEAAVVRLIYSWFLGQELGAYAIARQLTALGIPSPTGGGRPWSATMVRRILTNEKYCGDLAQGKTCTVDHLSHRRGRCPGGRLLLRDHHEAIVPRAQFEAVQAELARRTAGQRTGGRHSAAYWFSGLLHCAQCGRTVGVRRSRRQDGSERRTLVCGARTAHGGRGCALPPVPWEALEACVRFVWSWLGLPESEPASSDRLRREALAGQREQLLARRERAAERLADGTLSTEAYLRMDGRLEDALQRLTDALADAHETENAAADEEEARGRRYRAAFSSMTVGTEWIDLTLWEEALTFRVFWRTQGRGRARQVVVTGCTLMHPAEQK